MPKKDDFEYFAFVVENEVAVVIPINKYNLENWVAALSSDPKVIKLEDSQKDIVISGWTFDGESFSAPIEG